MEKAKFINRINKLINLKWKLRHFILLVLFATPIIDIVNGIIGEGSLFGKFVRSMIVVLNCAAILYTELKQHSKRNVAFFAFAIYLFVHFLLFSLLQGNGGLTTDLGAYLKIVLFVSETVLLFNCLDLRIIQRRDLELFWKYSLILIPASLFIASITDTAMSYGFGGNRGYFVSVNALTVVMIMQVNISVLFALQKKLPWMIVLLNLLSIFLIGTKTSYFFVAFSFVLTFAYLLLKNKKYFKRFALFCLLCVLILYIVLIKFFGDRFNSILDYQLSFLQKAIDNGTLFNYLVSGRDQLLGAGFKVMEESGIGFLFGVGFSTLERGIANVLGLEGIRGIEMDPFEIWFSFGSPAVIFIYGFFFLVLRKKTKFKAAKFITNLTIFLTLVYSFLGGHAIMESLGGTYCAILLAYRFSLNDPLKEK